MIRRKNVQAGSLTRNVGDRFFVPPNGAQAIVANVVINTLSVGDKLTIVGQPRPGICMTMIAADASPTPIQLMFRGSNQFGETVTQLMTGTGTSRRTVRTYFSCLDEIVVVRDSISVNNLSIGYFFTDETDLTIRPRFPCPAKGMEASDIKIVQSKGPYDSYDGTPAVSLTDFAVTDVDEDGDTFGVDFDLSVNTDFATLNFDVHVGYDLRDLPEG